MKTLKIAAVTEDGQKLSNHFGMASQYRVFTVIDGRVTGETSLDKPHHQVHPDHSQPGHHHGLHEDMFAPIQDCQVLLVGGMGQGAYNRAQAANLEVVFVGGPIEQAVNEYLSGKLVSDARRLHTH